MCRQVSPSYAPGLSLLVFLFWRGALTRRFPKLLTRYRAISFPSGVLPRRRRTRWRTFSPKLPCLGEERTGQGFGRETVLQDHKADWPVS